MRAGIHYSQDSNKDPSLTLGVGSLLGLAVVGNDVGLVLIGCLVGSFVGAGVLEREERKRKTIKYEL